MGVDTFVNIRLPDTVFSEVFLDELDACFLQVSHDLTTGWMRWESDPVTEWFDSGRRDVLSRALTKDSAIWFEYLSAESGDCFPVTLHFSAEMRVGELRIDSTVDAFKTWYTVKERDYMLNLQRVSELIHQRFHALETWGTHDWDFDTWFRFSGDARQYIEHLPLTEDYHRYDLTLRSPQPPEHDFYEHLDVCLGQCGFTPWRIHLYTENPQPSTTDIEQRLEAHKRASALRLFYRHGHLKETFAYVFMRFEDETRLVQYLWIEVYLPPRELPKGQIEGILSAVSDSLRKTFGGRYWDPEGSRYLWTTE